MSEREVHRCLDRIYKSVKLRYKLYVLIRSRLCVAFGRVKNHVPQKGRVVDLGCGYGVFANLLADESKERDVVGIDISAEKIKAARDISGGKNNPAFLDIDISNGLSIPAATCITILDVLCYLPHEKQKELMQKCYQALEPGGRLLIKSISHRPFWKYLWFRFHMAVIDKIINQAFEQNAYLYFKEEFIKLLEGIGFEVEYRDISKGYIYPNCLYICSRKEAM